MIARTLALAAALATASLAGCYRSRFDLAPPSAETTSTIYDNQFHWSVLNVIEASSPVNLATACGGAPATAIEEDTGVVGGLVNAALSYIIPVLHVKNATVKCRAAGETNPSATSLRR